MKRIQWPTALVLGISVLVLGSVYLFGPAFGVPESSHVALVAGIAVVGKVALAYMRALLAEKKADDREARRARAVGDDQ